MAESIKVVVRFRGNEEETNNPDDLWTYSDDKTAVNLPLKMQNR
jgi:hypothetical protein